MKFLFLLIAFSSSAMAWELNPHFVHTLRKPKSIGLCKGTSLRVLSVNRLGATYSEGSHGRDVSLTQAIVSRGFRKVDLRATTEAELRRYDIRGRFRYGQSLGYALDPIVALMEQLEVRNSTTSACISRFDLKKIDQVPGVGSLLHFDLGYKIYLTSDTPWGLKSILVQELRGEYKTRTQYFNLFYDWSIKNRAGQFLDEAWHILDPKLAQFLKPVPNEEANRNLNGIKAELEQILGGV